MKVVINNNEFTVSWNYTNSVYENLLSAAGMTHKEAKKLSREDLLIALKVTEIPETNEITCALFNSEKELLTFGKIKRWSSKPFNKGKYRKYALKSMVSTMDVLEHRAAVWEAFLKRRKSPEFRLYEKLHKKYGKISVPFSTNGQTFSQNGHSENGQEKHVEIVQAIH